MNCHLCKDVAIGLARDGALTCGNAETCTVAVKEFVIVSDVPGASTYETINADTVKALSDKGDQAPDGADRCECGAKSAGEDEDGEPTCGNQGCPPVFEDEKDFDADWEAEDRDDDGNLMFADPGGRSALRASSDRNPRNLPCPNCGEPDRLTPADRAHGYQCDACADRAEGWGG